MMKTSEDLSDAVWGSKLIRKRLTACIYRCSVLHILYTFYSEVIKGYNTYKRLKLGTDGAGIFLQYYPGTGDVYLSSAYLKYRESRQDKFRDSIFAVNGMNAYRVATLMGLEKIPVVKLSEREAFSLVHLTKFIGQDNVDIRYLHYMSDRPMYTNFFITLAGLHDIGFMDLYRDIVYDGEMFELPGPRWNRGSKFGDERKRVLFAPVANSVAEGPGREFWQDLAKKIKLLGYETYTNVSGNEEPIEGTEPVFIPYEDLAAFLNEDAVLIGYRSGLCDLAASLKCKKIILYPKSSWPAVNGLDIGSTLDIFSLNKMGLCEDAIEFEYSEKDEAQVLSGILGAITEC